MKQGKVGAAGVRETEKPEGGSEKGGLDIYKFGDVESHIIGNLEVRRDRSKEFRMVERWRAELSRYDVQVFEKIAGEVNRQLGYS